MELYLEVKHHLLIELFSFKRVMICLPNPKFADMSSSDYESEKNPKRLTDLFGGLFATLGLVDANEKTSLDYSSKEYYSIFNYLVC